MPPSSAPLHRVSRFDLPHLLGNGDGTFQEARSFPTSAEPYSIAAGDFNDDGLPDLAILHQHAGDVGVLLGNGDGAFQAARYFGAGIAPLAVAASDFNGDGKADIAVVNSGQPSADLGEVTILINNTPCSPRPGR